VLAAFAVDGAVMAAVKPLRHSPFADLLSNTIRWLGNGRFQVPALLLLVAAGALWGRRLLRAGAWGLLAFVVSGAGANLVKVLVRRPRPFASLPTAETWLDYLKAPAFQSFPSGDAATAFAIAWVLAHHFPRARWPLLVTAVAVAIARVLVGSHYPSDVCAGAILGLAVGHWVVGLARRRGEKGD